MLRLAMPRSHSSERSEARVKTQRSGTGESLLAHRLEAQLSRSNNTTPNNICRSVDP